MLYEATNVIPSVLTKSGAVDANDYISVSFQMSGTSKLYGFVLSIRGLEDNYSGSTFLMYAPDNTYATDENGNPVRFSYTSPYYKWSNIGMVNGKSYAYHITLYWYEGSTLKSVACQSEEVIYTRTPPVVALGYSDITSPKKTLTATFAQSQGDTVALARWVVCQYGKEDSPILDTGAIPTQVLSHTCNFFRDGKKYGIRLYLTSSTGYEYDSDWTWITADFTDVTEQSSQIDVACANGYGADIQFEKPSECQGVVTGSVAIDTDVINETAQLSQGCVKITDDSILKYLPEQEIESPRVIIRQKAYRKYEAYDTEKVLLGSNAFCTTPDLIFYIESVEGNPVLQIKNVSPVPGSPNYGNYDTVTLQGLVKGNSTYSIVSVSEIAVMEGGLMVILTCQYDVTTGGSTNRYNGVFYWVYDKASTAYGTFGFPTISTVGSLVVQKDGSETYVYCGYNYAVRSGNTLGNFFSINFSSGYPAAIYNMTMNPKGSSWTGGSTIIINGKQYMIINGSTFSLMSNTPVDSNITILPCRPSYSPDGKWFATPTGIYIHSGTSHTINLNLSNLGVVFAQDSLSCLILTSSSEAKVYTLSGQVWSLQATLSISLLESYESSTVLASMRNDKFFASNMTGDIQYRNYLEAFQIEEYPKNSSMVVKVKSNGTTYTETKQSITAQNSNIEYYFIYEFVISTGTYNIYRYGKTSMSPYYAYIDSSSGTLSLPTDGELVEIQINGRAYVTGLAVLENLVNTSILSNPYYVPNWGDGNDYLLLALYTNNADAGVISSDYGGILIYRTDTEGNDYKIVAESDANAWHSRDYSLQSGKQYKYGAYVLDSSNMLSRIYASNVVIGMLFKRHTLLVTEIMEDGCYHVRREYYFDGNLSEGNVSNNNSPTILQNFTRYPSISKSHANYESGTLTALIGNVSRYGQYNECLALLNELKELSRQKYTLFLRDMKGTIKMVAISSPQTYSRNLGNALMQTTLSLPWTEIGDAEKEKVIMTDDDDIATFDLVNSPLNIARNGWGENHG